MLGRARVVWERCNHVIWLVSVFLPSHVLRAWCWWILIYGAWEGLGKGLIGPGGGEQVAAGYVVIMLPCEKQVCILLH